MGTVIEIASYFNAYALVAEFFWWLWREGPTKEEIMKRCTVDGALELPYTVIKKGVSVLSNKT